MRQPLVSNSVMSSGARAGEGLLSFCARVNDTAGVVTGPTTVAVTVTHF
jgi:hypothetical protein